MAEDGGGGPGPPSEPPSFADFDFNEEDLGVGMDDEMEDVSETVSRSAYDDDGQGSVLSDLASSDMGDEPTPPTRTAAQERAERAYIMSLGGHLRHTCLGCRKSRQKCDRRFPCNRCQAKGCSCVLSSKERADMVLARLRGTFVYNDDEQSVASGRSAFPRGDGDVESRAGTVVSEDGRTDRKSVV